MQAVLEWVFSSSSSPSRAPSATTTVGFEDVLYFLQPSSPSPPTHVFIHTLSPLNESVLIRGTLLAKEEETFMERYLAGELQQEYTFVVYGRHNCDAAPYRKQAQLRSLGIGRVYVYAGGLFEWLLLQDVYGSEAFPTRGAPPKDLLTFRPLRQLA